jgi:hypothetical protein
MLVSDILFRAGRLLSDPTHVRWATDELIDYINDAQRQIVLLVPDANSRTESFVLANESRQTLPAGAIRLLRITRNMGSDGNTPGRVVYPTLRSALDAEIPLWHTTTGLQVEHYIYDPESNPKVFYVYPAISGGQVEIVYSTNPAVVTASGDTLELGDQYINPILDWVLYRCWAKDAEYAGNVQRAQMHESSFYNQLGVKDQAAALANPTRRVRNSEIELR